MNHMYESRLYIRDYKKINKYPLLGLGHRGEDVEYSIYKIQYTHIKQ